MTSPFAEPVSSLYASLSDVSANIQYIQKALPTVSINATERSQIVDLCDEFNSALYDVRKEVRNLEDKLGLHAGEPPFDPDIVNPDPKVTMGFIERWLWEPIELMHATVMRLKIASKADPKHGVAYLLIAESAVNILNAYSAIKDALATIESGISAASPPPPAPA